MTSRKVSLLRIKVETQQEKIDKMRGALQENNEGSRETQEENQNSRIFQNPREMRVPIGVTDQQSMLQSGEMKQNVIWTLANPLQYVAEDRLSEVKTAM